MSKKFWSFVNKTETSAELMVYGDISDSSWWGDEVTPKQFADELKAVGDVTDITVRINSGGGDVFAAQAIGNLLEQHSANVTARIDGLCASAATIIACHCNKVTAAKDSTYMIHPVRMGLMGYKDETELQTCIGALQTIRDNILSLYEKKTGRCRDDVAAQMDATTWFTGQQAMENGFIDELIDDGSTTVENRNGMLFVNSVSSGVPFDLAPDFVQSNQTAAPAPDCSDSTTNPNEEDSNMEIQTLDELRNAYPELVAQAEQQAADNATNAERQRIQDIEEMSLPGSEAFTNDAKFANPISANDYAKQAMKNAKAQGASYLASAMSDSAQSGAQQVESTPVADDADEFLDAIKSVRK